MKKKWSKRHTAAALSLQLHSENCFSNTRNIQSSSSEASYYYSYYSYYYHRHTVVSVSSDGHWWSSAPVLWVSTVSGLLQTDSFKLIYRHFLGPNWPWVQSLWWSITTACLEEHTLPHVNEGTCGWRGCVPGGTEEEAPPPDFNPPTCINLWWNFMRSPLALCYTSFADIFTFHVGHQQIMRASKCEVYSFTSHKKDSLEDELVLPLSLLQFDLRTYHDRMILKSFKNWWSGETNRRRKKQRSGTYNHSYYSLCLLLRV